jgi:hypothetical protein
VQRASVGGSTGEPSCAEAPAASASAGREEEKEMRGAGRWERRLGDELDEGLAGDEARGTSSTRWGGRADRQAS